MEIQHSNNTEAINEVDADVASMRIFMQMGNTLATLIMAPIIGAWADYGGRRKPLITILIGLEVYVVAQTLGVYFYTRVNVFYFFLTAEIFSGLCGGLASLTTLAMSIVSDDARADRTFVSPLNSIGHDNLMESWLYV
jgi:MFS family permease